MKTRKIVLVGNNKDKNNFTQSLDLSTSNNYRSVVGMDFISYQDGDSLYLIYDMANNFTRFQSAYKSTLEMADLIIFVNASAEQEHEVRSKHSNKNITNFDASKQTVLECLRIVNEEDKPKEKIKRTPLQTERDPEQDAESTIVGDKRSVGFHNVL